MPFIFYVLITTLQPEYIVKMENGMKFYHFIFCPLNWLWS